MIYFRSSLFLLLCISLSASAQNFNRLANKAEKANHHCKAAILAAKSLQFNPEKNKKGQKLLAECYPEAIRINELLIRSLSESSVAFKGDETAYQKLAIVNKYDSLILLQKEYSLIPSSAKNHKKLQLEFAINDYSSQLSVAKDELKRVNEKAAQMHYNEAITLMESDEIEYNRAAVRELNQAMYFVDNFRNTKELHEKASKKGVKRIALIPFADKSYTSDFGDVGERIVDLIRSNAQSGLEGLTEFISPTEVANAFHINTLDINDVITPNNAAKLGSDLKIDEVWIGQITQLLAPENDKRTNSRETLERSVKVGEESYINKKGKKKTRPVYADVTATVLKHTRSNGGALNYSFQVIDVRKKEFGSIEAASEEVSYSHSYYSYYSGDKRAFSYVETEDKTLPSSIQRTDEMIEAAGIRLAEMIVKQEKEIIIPLKTEVGASLSKTN